MIIKKWNRIEIRIEMEYCMDMWMRVIGDERMIMMKSWKSIVYECERMKWWSVCLVVIGDWIEMNVYPISEEWEVMEKVILNPLQKIWVW